MKKSLCQTKQGQFLQGLDFWNLTASALLSEGHGYGRQAATVMSRV